MFVRTIKRKSSHRNIAVQIVESYRNDKGQPRQRILRHMGTAPEGEPLEQLKRIANSEMEKMLKYKPLPLLPVTTEASIGRSEQISFSSPISPWRYFSRAQVWLLSPQPNAELLVRSFNAVFAPVFAQQAQYAILIC